MVRSDLFANKENRVKIALRDVLNFNPTADVRPAIIHEAVEHELMNTRALWVTDGTQAYDYVLDVELSEIDIKNDDAAEKRLWAQCWFCLICRATKPANGSAF